MEYNNATTTPGAPSSSEPVGHSMGRALLEHRVAMLVACAASLLAGIPLAINMFWHLQVKTQVDKPECQNASKQ